MNTDAVKLFGRHAVIVIKENLIPVNVNIYLVTNPVVQPTKTSWIKINKITAKNPDPGESEEKSAFNARGLEKSLSLDKRRPYMPDVPAAGQQYRQEPD